jgi:hypothetical protein
VDEEPVLRPLPHPPRCRGIPLGDGNYTGCAYGYGDVAPFTGPRDCPVCNGSGFESHIETTLPHSDFVDPECCGCLNGVIRGEQADIVCNECGTVLRTVPAANVGQTLTVIRGQVLGANRSQRSPSVCNDILAGPSTAEFLDGASSPCCLRAHRSYSAENADGNGGQREYRGPKRKNRRRNVVRLFPKLPAHKNCDNRHAAA